MENVKVDIRKLQLLNDRINQCIDALTQVRLSVHGLSHTSQGGVGNPFLQGQNPFLQGQNPFQGQGGLTGTGIGQQGGMNPYGNLGYGQGIGQTTLGHTGVGQGYPTPFGVQGLQQPWGMQQQTQGWPQQFLQGQVGQYGSLGLSHTSELDVYNRGLNDPFLAARIQQTFPYAQLQFPPVVPLI